jgi:small subunit ribosomal protein S6
MALYETVVLMRQDLVYADVEKAVQTFSAIANEQNGSLVKHEYWGLRSLSYEIHNNKKAHYVMLCLDLDPSGLKELERKLKLTEEVIRFLSIKVKEFSEEASPLLKEKAGEIENLEIEIPNLESVEEVKEEVEEVKE